MKNIKRLFFKYALICVLGAFVLMSTSCHRDAQGQQKNENSSTDLFTLTLPLDNFELFELEIDMPMYKQKSAVALLDDGIVFVHLDSPVVYYRYYFSTGEFIKIGSVEDVAITLSHYELIDGMLYSYATIADMYDDVYMLTNLLFGIDLQNNQLLRLSESRMTEPLVSGFYHQGSIVSLKNKLDAVEVTSYLDRFDLDTNISTVELESFAETELNTGVAKVLHATDDNFIYILYLYLVDVEMSEDTGAEAVIRVYDGYMNHVRDINIGEVARMYDEHENRLRDISMDEIANYIFSSRPLIFRVFGGEYIYMLNVSLGV
ncbi:MAG: hypothetical protein FWE20_02530 [Defluviitaleaceae bacterium]|nr:hypothetical protein [Defluviitaleaceae bacterium]